MQYAQQLGQLPVLAHRVGEPRHPDQARVGGDEEDRRGEDADVDLGRVLERAQVHVLDHAQHRVVGVPALLLRRGPLESVPLCTGMADSATAGRNE